MLEMAAISLKTAYSIASYTLFANNDETPKSRRNVNSVYMAIRHFGESIFRHKRFAVSPVRWFFDETQKKYSSTCNETIFI